MARTGTVHVPEGSTVPPVLGAAILMVDYGALGTTSTVTQVFENQYVGPLAPIRSDGTVELAFPDRADMPAAVLLPVEESVMNFSGATECTLSASDPSVVVTPTAYEGLSLPGVALVTAEGLFLALATDEEVENIEAPGALVAARSQTWVYASGPTRLQTSPATCQFPLPSESTISVNVSLSAGWTSLEWVMDTDESGAATGITLRNSTAEELHLLPVVALGGE